MGGACGRFEQRRGKLGGVIVRCDGGEEEKKRGSIEKEAAYASCLTNECVARSGGPARGGGQALKERSEYRWVY